MEFNEISTRSCLYEDSDFIYNLKKVTLKTFIEQIWGWNEEWNIKYFKNSFIPKNYQIIRYKNEDIGCIAILNHENDIEIENLEILPKYQHYGIGSNIMKKQIQSAITQNKKIILQVFKNNKHAINFYIKLGFNAYDESNTHFKMKFEEKKN